MTGLGEPHDIERRSSGGPWENTYGYSRVVRAGGLAWVAGSTAVVDGELIGEGDAYRQTLEAFAVALRALESVAMGVADVVRTRMFIVNAADADAVGRAHSTVFDAVRPASTLVVVKGLLDVRMLVEVEIDAYRQASRPPA